MSNLVSARLGKLCEAAGVSHESVSLSAGLAGGHVGHIVHGRIKRPTADVLAKIAEVLGVTLDWLVCGKGDEPNAQAVCLRVIERARRRRVSVVVAA